MPAEFGSDETPAQRLLADSQRAALNAFHRAARTVPAYSQLLVEARITAGQIASPGDLEVLPVLTKANTFQRFAIEDLCVDRSVGRLASVLTSSGHSKVFAFGLNEIGSHEATAEWIDGLLDLLFSVKSQPTLLINCLPMGVKVPTKVCTLAETSVRADMAIGLVKAFAGKHFTQIILVGEAAFVKHLLELGQSSGVKWPSLRVHVILGEEPLAENTRKYLESILEIDSCADADRLVFSSMGVGEIGLNLFSEVPPAAPLICLRRLLHDNAALRSSVIGDRSWVPSLFTYDPRRIYVEFDPGGRLLLTNLDPEARLPLVRYATGDHGAFFAAPADTVEKLEHAGVPRTLLDSLPIVMIEGRGHHTKLATGNIYPEAVKEGLYLDPALARQTTANFRIAADRDQGLIRIQLGRGIQERSQLSEQFAVSISKYINAAFHVRCQRYETFGSGMSLDHERKFDYLGP